MWKIIVKGTTLACITIILGSQHVCFIELRVGLCLEYWIPSQSEFHYRLGRGYCIKPVVELNDGVLCGQSLLISIIVYVGRYSINGWIQDTTPMHFKTHFTSKHNQPVLLLEGSFSMKESLCLPHRRRHLAMRYRNRWLHFVQY